MGFLSSFITPALVAGIISLAVNNSFEKSRAQRDFVTKAFDPARDAVKSAVEAAVDYFPETFAQRTLKMEGQIIAMEREVRRAVAWLLNLHGEFKTATFNEVDEAYALFVAELTSGSFQQINATADLATAIRVADAGANLRASLIALRSEVLDRSVDSDWFSALKRLPGQVVRYFRS